MTHLAPAPVPSIANGRRPLPPDLRALFDEAVAHHRHGRYLDALGLYERILDTCPDDAPTNYHVAVAARQLGNLELVERFLRRAIANADLTRQLTWKLELAHILVTQHRLREANAILDEAAPYAEGSADYFDWMGKIKIALELYEEAVAAFATAARGRPDDPQAWLQLADAQSKSDGHHEAAHETLLRAIAADPNSATLQLHIARYYMDQDDPDRAEPYARRGLALCAEQNAEPDAFHYYCLAMAEAALGRRDEADRLFGLGLKRCDEAILAGGDVAHQALGFKARLLFAMGREEDGRTFARSAAASTRAVPRDYSAKFYLSDTPARLARLAGIIRGRDVALLAHGPSIRNLEARIGELAGRDICYASINRFGVVESSILSQIGRRLDIVAPTNPTEYRIQSDRIVAFLDRDDDNMVVTSRYASTPLPHPLPDGREFYRAFDRKLLHFFSAHVYPAVPRQPLHLVPGNTPSVIIPLLALGRPRRIYLFGGDGGAGLDATGPTHFKMDTAEFRQEQDERAFARFRHKLRIDAAQFNRQGPFTLAWTTAFHDVPEPPVYIVSPESNYRCFPRIDYDRALAEIGR